MVHGQGRHQLSVASKRLFATILVMNRSAAEWLSAFAAQLGVDAPGDDERDAILALAGVAAHSSERMAAPVACWLAAKAGVTAQEARTIALQIDALDVGDDAKLD